MDEGALRKWMGFELGRLHSSLVTQPVPLARLLAEPEPSAATRSGDAIAFDADVLRRLAARLPRDLPPRLRLPITVVEPQDNPGDGYVQDAAALLAVQALGAATMSPAPDGKLWMALPLWRRLAGEWPGCFQFLML